ncbi:MAG: Maf-like protein [Tannerella sp.]|jgi:septum formation protein|nr:Maf-like protein [Tannerella sp.]
MALEDLTRHIILASHSPRRRELLSGLGIDFEVRVIPGIDESYPSGLPPAEIPCYLARKKAEAYRSDIKEDELIITADTVVILDNEILEKPRDRNDAIRMLHRLAGRTHEVVTGVVITAANRQSAFSVISAVDFAALTDKEIRYYVDTFQPYDKAGAYGIQEWIGFIGVQGIRGSFYNVMGLPVQRLYQELKKFSGNSKPGPSENDAF